MNNDHLPACKSRKWLMRNNKSSLPGPMIYHCLPSIIRQVVRAFKPAMHGIFKCFITHPAMDSKSNTSQYTGFITFIYRDWQKLVGGGLVLPSPLHAVDCM